MEEERGAAQHFCCVTGKSRGPLNEDVIYLRTFLMLNSGLVLVLTALSGRCCPEKEGDVAHLFEIFTWDFCHALHAITFLVVIPDLSLFIEQETSFTCQLTSLNFVLPTFSVALKEQPR